MWRKRASESQLSDELRYHLDKLIESHIAAGMSPDAARRQAVFEFGPVEPAKEQLRDLRPHVWAETLLADLRYAKRKLASAPAFTAVAVLSLALGIGANTAVFSLVNATMLRLIPVERPGELVWFATSNFGRVLNHPYYQHIAADPRFEGVLATFPTIVNAGQPGAVERVEMELVSGNYFQVLGVRPHLGRLVTPEDDRTRLGHPVAVVAYHYWQSRLGADPNIIGRTVPINGSPYTIIGVSKPGFFGIDQGWQRALFVPMHMKAAITPGWDGLEKPLIAWLQLVGRVKPGVNTEAMSRELTERLHTFQKPYLDADARLTQSQREMIRTRSIRLEPLSDGVLDTRVRQHLKTLVWMVGALLLLACVNLAGLLLARGLERQREIATRLAIGASRARVIRQLFLESLLLAVLGAAAGLGIAMFAAPLIASRFPLAGQGSSFDVQPDARVLAYTVAVSLLACLLFGLMPAWQATKLDLIATIRGAMQGPRGRLLRHSLLGVQVAVALVLLTLAGLFSVSLNRLLHLDLGFQRQNLLLAEIEPVLSGYKIEQLLNLYARMEARLGEALRDPASGITRYALSNVAPVSGYYWTSGFVIQGREREKDLTPLGMAVSGGYFETLGIRMRQGRLLEERDGPNAPKAAVISESLARKAFPEGNAVGQKFSADWREPEKTRFEIVGVVADVNLHDPRNSNLRDIVYVPYRQWAFPPQAIVIHARLVTPEASAAAMTSLRRMLRDVDPNLALYDIRLTDAALANVLRTERLIALLSGGFALLAALLAAIGLHGILAREVAARTRELGIRVALGASRRALLWSLAARSLAVVAIGAGAGIAALLLLQPLLKPLLIELEPSNLGVLTASVGVLALAAAAGALWPSRRATRVNPASALRCD